MIAQADEAKGRSSFPCGVPLFKFSDTSQDVLFVSSACAIGYQPCCPYMLTVCVARCCSSSPRNARDLSRAFVLYRGAFPRRESPFSGIINRLDFWHFRKTNDTYDLAA